MTSLSKAIIYLSLVVVLALIGGFFGYKYWQTVQNDPQRQAKELLKYVSSISDTPPETPTIATVTDTSQAKRLILYRPSTKKVVETLTIEEQARKTSDSASEPSSQTKP